ncbi:hypothetical protein TNIN_85171 [Trichonephila inaurata madagascariensis]|uniref:Integrase zinc-binding domain-containing protein n=1 Tax=Trichonephila inaurata madagascariensis TaxID=2747483 RepID=A0A8X7C7V4_9ARAC|nr:hypothetical protein TNIN_85171 [Trichonephila inaurata madagascariensis]
MKNQSDINDFSSMSKNLPKDSKFRELNPFLNERGNVTDKWKIASVNIVNYHEKHPILIPVKIRFTELLVQNAYEKVLHSGVADTLIQVREKYWVPKGCYAPSKVAKSPVPVTNYAPFRQWPIKSNDRDSFSEDASAQREEIHRSIDENDQTKYLVIDSINMQGYTLVNDRLELSNLEDWLENLPFENIDCFK